MLSFEMACDFNSGYHDGQYDVAYDRIPEWARRQDKDWREAEHFNPVYKAGYTYGRFDFATTWRRSNCSQDAQDRYEASLSRSDES